MLARRRSDGAVTFDVGMESNVLYVQTMSKKRQHGSSDAIMAAIESGTAGDVADDVKEGTLLHFHHRFAHLALDTIERMARDPASGNVSQASGAWHAYLAWRASRRVIRSRSKTAARTRRSTVLAV